MFNETPSAATLTVTVKGDGASPTPCTWLIDTDCHAV